MKKNTDKNIEKLITLYVCIVNLLRIRLKDAFSQETCHTDLSQILTYSNVPCFKILISFM